MRTYVFTMATTREHDDVNAIKDVQAAHCAASTISLIVERLECFVYTVLVGAGTDQETGKIEPCATLIFGVPGSVSLADLKRELKDLAMIYGQRETVLMEVDMTTMLQSGWKS